MKNLLFFISIALLTACGGNKSNIPDNIKYEIIKEERNNGLGKSNIEVRLNIRTTEAVLKDIALELKSERTDLSMVWIFYYLPDMVTGSGAWATTHFTPQLEVEILGGTEEEVAKMEATSVTGEILSEWKDNTPMMESKKYLVKEDGKLFIKTVYHDGSEMSEEVTEAKEGELTRYNYENTHGEYYLLETNGNLGFYDDDGKFREAKLVK